MAATSATRPAPPLQRDGAGGLLGGVCSGLARRFGLSPLFVRLAFMVAAAFGGVGVALYALAWIVLPADPSVPPAERARGRRASIEVSLGAGLLLLSGLLALREAGLWVSDAVVWPLVLVASGAVLLWRQSAAAPADSAAVAAPAAAPPADVQPAEGRVALVSRTGFGVALVVAAGIVFLQATGALSTARDVVLAALVVAVVVAMIFAPLVARLARSLTAERRERIRSQERAEMAAHLHDSVLQTLALVQKRAGDPAAVATLARRQERELRTWLSGRTPAAGAETLGAALEAAADEVERGQGVPVEVVAVGERPLDEGGQAVLGAAREAMLNAAKFGAGSPVDVYAEADERRVAVFVRDRGPGFDLSEVPPDRRGVRESIVGRMERHGGRASIHSTPGEGTEVELVLEEP